MAELTRIIQTGCGQVRGKLDEAGRAVYLGVPYAKAERFCSPQPVCWEGVRAHIPACLVAGPEASHAVCVAGGHVPQVLG